MNKNIFILAIVSLLTFQSFSQAFYQLEGDHLSIFKITVSSPAANKISVKFPLQSSRRCACEENEVIELEKNENGDYVNIISKEDGLEKYVIANVYDGKVKSIIVKNSQYGCCEISGGVYLLKPVTGKIENVIAVPSKFMSFWKNFQSNITNKDVLMKSIDFPYSVSASYFDSLTTVSQSDFETNGTNVFVNGNAFISNEFTDSKGYYFGMFTGGYMNENLHESFKNKYGDLDNIYYISLLGHQEDEVFAKAYFKEINGDFKFIGFENNMEMGD